MKEKMTSKFCLHIAVLLFCLFCIVPAQAQILDYYEETGVNPFQTQDSIVPNESVDPFSGIIQLSHTDIFIPGNGGLDIVVNRSYTSSRRSLLNLPGEALGAGWKFHFGRISGRDLTVCLEDNDFDEYTTNNVSVEMNSGSQDLLVRSSIAGVDGLISKNNLRAKCTDDPFSVVDNVIITPDGTRYEHKKIGKYSRVNRIEDVHGNWIRIEYDSQGLPLEIYRKEESEESTTNGGSEQPVLTFQYKTELVTKKYLESITYGEKIWQYSVELFDHPNGASDFYLTQATRPDGKTWKYAYFPNDYVGFPDPSNPDLDPYLNASPGAASIQKITYPDGGEVDYTYQAVGFTQNVESIKHHVIETKTITDPITNSSATWTYQFAPRSDETYPGTDKVTDETGTYVLNERLALDVTTVRSPYGTEVYRHIGNHVATYDVPTSPVNNDKKFAFFEQALVGNLIRKEVYGTDNILIEARTYNWGLREISDEKYTRGFFNFNLVATRISDDQTSAPLLLSEYITYDLQWNGTTYGVTSYETYDEFGNPTRIRESGNTSDKADTIIEYEYANNLEKWIIGLPTKKTIRFEGAAGVATTTSEYDLETGNLTKITDLGIPTEYTYHSNGELKTVKDANDVVTQYENYSRGVATSQKNGLRTQSGVLPTHISPLITENSVVRTVNPSGTIASIINPNENETKYSYDLFDRVISIDFPLNADVSISYSNVNAGGGPDCATCATRTITRGIYKRIDYLDGFGRVIITHKFSRQIGDLTNKILKTRYDLLGRTLFVSLPNSEDGISYEYDALNRQTKRINSDGTFSTTSYIQNNAVKTTDELGNTIDRLYDDIGSTLQYGDMIQELRNGADGVGTKYTRDVLGNVIELFHGDYRNGGLTGFTRLYEYNDQFQLIKEDNFETPDREFTYDDAGFMTTSSTIGANIINSYVYDTLYRLKTIQSSDSTPDLSYEYDSNSNTVKTVNGIVEKTYQYDNNDNLILEELDIGAPYNKNYSHAYTYNDRDVLSSLEYPSGLVTDFAPDVLGRQKKAGVFARNVQYFPSSHLKSYTLGNNKTVHIDLDDRLFVKNINVNNLIDLSYSYDSVGNVKSINDALDSARNVSIPNDGYDAVYRLRKATGPWGDVEYDYSDGRPMDFKTRTLNGQVETYIYDVSHNGNLSEFFPAGSTQASDLSYRYSYDKLGNISQRKKRIFSSLFFSEFTLEETNFQYDANSRLLRAGDKQYLYDAGGMQVAEIGFQARDRKFNFYNQAEELVFEYDRRKCMTTDYIRLESTQIAKSDDTDEQDTDGDQLSDCHEENIGNDINDPSDGNVDTDGDGVEDREEINVIKTNPYEVDSDGDGANDDVDPFPNDPSRSGLDVDSDGDGVVDALDAFPNDPSETVDTDGDGVGDNADEFPNDPSESVDSDRDGVGDNLDAFPNNPNETIDSDGDGVGDNEDEFPNDPTQTITDTDGDGVADRADAFPNDPAETADTDGDGIGDNADTAQDYLYVFNRDSIGDHFGRTVSYAGDVNNDGYGDIIVGAKGDDDNGLDSGSVRIYSGADGSTLFTFYGRKPGAYFGASVSSAGDVNGDGHADVVVGSIFQGNDVPADRGNSGGSAFVYSGVDGALLYELTDDISKANNFGHTVSGAGDVNNDGYADIIVGAHRTSTGGDTFTGSAFVYSGNGGHLLYRFNGRHRTYFGSTVSGAGDVNNDGYDDVIITAYRDKTVDHSPVPGAGVGSGSVEVRSGKDGTLIHHFFPDKNADGYSDIYRFGGSISGAGDVNNDGHADIIVSENGLRGTPNAAKVFSGINGDLLYIFNQVIDSRNTSIISVSQAGDVNGDGHSDVLVGATSLFNRGANSGSVRVYSGKNGQILHESNGGKANDFYGVTVSGGDVNGDGLADIIIGADNGNVNNSFTYDYLHLSTSQFYNSGYVRVIAPFTDSDRDGVHDGIDVFPNDSTESQDTDGDGVGDNGDAFPHDPSETTDTDGDGVGDNRDLFPNDPTRFDVDSDGDGVVDSLDAFPDDPTETSDSDADGIGDNADTFNNSAFVLNADRPSLNDYIFVVSFSDLGDINNDGHDDIVISSTGDLINGQAETRVHIVSGRDQTRLHQLAIPAIDLPVQVNRAGDVNNDGITDVVVGIPYGTTNAAYVYSGADGSLLHEITGSSDTHDFGAEVSDAGDINNDGHDDIMVSARSNSSSTETIYIFSGQDGSELYNLAGADSRLIYSISSLGDINNDGHDDIITGSPYRYDSQASDYFAEGKAIVYSGADGSILYEINGDADVLFGIAVSDAGDINEDGYPDFLVGQAVISQQGQNLPAIKVFSGVDGTLLRTLESSSFANRAYLSLDNAGDINGDNIPDVVMGTLPASSQPILLTPIGNELVTGQVEIFSGADGSVIAVYNRKDANGFGFKVTTAGDVNADGFDDIMAGSLGQRVEVILGQPATNTDTSNQTVSSLLSPISGSSFSSNEQTFRWADIAADEYRIRVGTTAGGKDIREIVGNNSFLQATISNLPVDGSTVYVTILAKKNNLYAESPYYSFTAHNDDNRVSDLLSPGAGSTFTSNEQTFQWEDIAADEYRIRVGTTAGGKDIREMVGNSSFLQATITNLPIDGSTVYVTILAKKYNLYQESPYYSFTSHSDNNSVSNLLSPVAGSTFTSNQHTFEWEDITADEYRIRVGTTEGGKDIREMVGNSSFLQATITNLPIDGSTVYVTILAKKYNLYKESPYYSFTAHSDNNRESDLLSPAAGSTFTSNQHTFEWEDVAADEYRIRVGTTAGGKDIREMVGNSSFLQATITNLPIDGSTVYVTILAKKYNLYTESPYYSFTAHSDNNRESDLLSPAAGSTFTSNQHTFQWEDIAADEYRIRVGTTEGGKDIRELLGNSSFLQATITNLPVDGSTVYVTILAKKYNVYTESPYYEFTAASQ